MPVVHLCNTSFQVVNIFGGVVSLKKIKSRKFESVNRNLQSNNIGYVDKKVLCIDNGIGNGIQQRLCSKCYNKRND